jgi:multiple sugar transport system permease protein
MSFVDLNVMTFRNKNTTFQGIGNYLALLEDKVFTTAFFNTFYFTFWCLVIQFSLGFMLALFFSKKFPLAGPIRGFILISYMIPMSVTGLLYRNMFATETGVINYILTHLGLVQSAVPWLINARSAMWALIIANCWVGIPFNMLLLTSGLSNIPDEIYESASIDGANAFQRFFSLTVPLLRSSIIAVLTLGFIYTFKVYDLVVMMTNGGPADSTQLLSTYAYRLSFTEYNFSKGAATGVVLFLCLLIVGFAYLNMMRKEDA